MAARTNKTTLTETWKAKIQASQILNRLNDHINGKIDLSNTQIAAAKIILGKMVPDLQSIAAELTGPNGGPLQHEHTLQESDKALIERYINAKQR